MDISQPAGRLWCDRELLPHHPCRTLVDKHHQHHPQTERSVHVGLLRMVHLHGPNNFIGDTTNYSDSNK